MKILVDENIPLLTVRTLRGMGHDILDIRGTKDKGIADERLWEIIQQEGRLLITTDKGFTQQRNERHYGILIIRLRKPNRQKIHNRIMQAMTRFSTEEWSNTLVVMRDEVQSIWHAHK